MRADPESAKKTVKVSIFCALLGSVHAKAARRMMKLTPCLCMFNWLMMSHFILTMKKRSSLLKYYFLTHFFTLKVTNWSICLHFFTTFRVKEVKIRFPQFCLLALFVWNNALCFVFVYCARNWFMFVEAQWLHVLHISDHIMMCGKVTLCEFVIVKAQ
jgi:hypothetical protein